VNGRLVQFFAGEIVEFSITEHGGNRTGYQGNPEASPELASPRQGVT
jgi:hypothetical protein